MGEVVDLQGRRLASKIEQITDARNLLDTLNTMDPAKVNTILVFEDDGRVIHWTKLKTANQFGWLKRCFDQIHKTAREKAGI